MIWALLHDAHNEGRKGGGWVRWPLINDVALFKLNYMRRSASVQGISNKDSTRNDPKVTHNIVDPVPVRMASRRYSSRQLPLPMQT